MQRCHHRSRYYSQVKEEVDGQTRKNTGDEKSHAVVFVIALAGILSAPTAPY
jgi:hypothetical protein